MVMVNGKALADALGSLADGTSASLEGVEGFVLLSRDSVGLTYPPVVRETLRQAHSVSVVGCAAWSRMWGRSLRLRPTILTRLTSL
jgi:hypothetical protein